MRTREHFEIKRSARRYDRTTGNFIIDISYETATEVTPRTIAVAEAFGLGVINTSVILYTIMWS